MIVVLLRGLVACAAFVLRPAPGRSPAPARRRAVELHEFDVVEFARNASAPVELGVAPVELGVALRDGRVQPLCCWQESDPVELVWDEDEPPVADFDVRAVVDAWPTQRLVDGGLGPNNPHGEESEDVYVVDRAQLAATPVLRADREVWW